MRVECGHSVLSCCLRLRAPDRQDTKPRGAAHATRASCAPPTSKAWHRGSPAALSVRETISLGMSESTRGRRMTPRLAPVAFEDLTVPKAAEGGKSARQGKAMEDKGKGKAEEGQDTYGDGGSSGRGGGRGQGRCRHGKQPGKCRECRGEGEAAGGKGRGREDPEMKRNKKRARTTQPRKKCPHGRRKNECKDCGGASICEHNRQRSRCKDCGGASICEHNRQRSQCKDCGGASICEHNRVRSRCVDCGGASICAHRRVRSTCKDCKRRKAELAAAGWPL